MGKKAGKGIFAKKTLSPALAAICGAKSLPRTEVTKKIWGYIKSHKLNEGLIIKPDSALKRSSRWRVWTCSKWPALSASTCPETMSSPGDSAEEFRLRAGLSSRDLKSWTRVTVDGLRNLMILLDCVFYFCRRSGHAHSSGG